MLDRKGGYYQINDNGRKSSSQNHPIIDNHVWDRESEGFRTFQKIDFDKEEGIKTKWKKTKIAKRNHLMYGTNP